MSQWFLTDYRCSVCARTTDELVRRDDIPEESPTPCHTCGGVRDRIISGTKDMRPRPWAQQGQSDERPPWALDTEAMADKDLDRGW